MNKKPEIETRFMADQKHNEYEIAFRRAANAKQFAEKEAIWLDFLKQYPESPKRIHGKAELAMLYYENSTTSKEAIRKGIQFFEQEKDDLIGHWGLRRYHYFLSRMKQMPQK